MTQRSEQARRLPPRHRPHVRGAHLHAAGEPQRGVLQLDELSEQHPARRLDLGRDHGPPPHAGDLDQVGATRRRGGERGAGEQAQRQERFVAGSGVERPQLVGARGDRRLVRAVARGVGLERGHRHEVVVGAEPEAADVLDGERAGHGGPDGAGLEEVPGAVVVDHPRRCGDAVLDELRRRVGRLRPCCRIQ